MRRIDALAGPYEDNPIHPDCKNMDYEVRESHLILLTLFCWC